MHSVYQIKSLESICSLPLYDSKGFDFDYTWASLVAQMVKNPPEMPETWVWSLGWEDPLEEGMTTLSSVLTWKIPINKGAWWATLHVVTESRTQLSDYAQHTAYLNVLFKSELCNKWFMIWATVSSWSCFCQLYGASPSSAAKMCVHTYIYVYINTPHLSPFICWWTLQFLLHHFLF